MIHCKKFHYAFRIIIFLSASLVIAQPPVPGLQKEYTAAAKSIKKKYERYAYTLKPSKAGHMGLRLWRNYKDDKYKYLMVQGVNHTANSLDKLVENGLDQQSLKVYVTRQNTKYKAKTKKRKLRKMTFEAFPNYRLMAAKILRHVARLDELGLRHEHHDEFMHLIRSYNYERVFTNTTMIKAWGAQLANQVYWLNNLGVADYRLEFQNAVAATYPDGGDNQLSVQQFENKIYTLTHIIIAASEYYRYEVDYAEYKSIIDYLRSNVDSILEHCKEDIIIEVGLSLLLVNETYSEINTVRSYLLNKVDSQKDMVLSRNGKSNVSQGEHRNIIAVLLLDWQGCDIIPSVDNIKQIECYLSRSLLFKG